MDEELQHGEAFGGKVQGTFAEICRRVCAGGTLRPPDQETVGFSEAAGPVAAGRVSVLSVGPPGARWPRPMAFWGRSCP